MQLKLGDTFTLPGNRRRVWRVTAIITKGNTMNKATKNKRGPKFRVAEADQLVPGSIRLSAKQWDKFTAWGGAAKLREVLNASRVKA